MKATIVLASFVLSCAAAPGNRPWGHADHDQAWSHGDSGPHPFEAGHHGPWAPWHHQWTQAWGSSTLQSTSTSTIVKSGTSKASQQPSVPVVTIPSAGSSYSVPTRATTSLSSAKSTLSISSKASSVSSLPSSTKSSSTVTQPSVCASTVTITTVSTVTPPAETSTTEILNGVLTLIGDDLGPPVTRATSYTKTFLDQATVFEAGTTTTTYTYGPNITVSKHATVTIQSPTGFIPVRSSLPSVYFFPNNYPNDPNPIVQKRAEIAAAADQICTSTVTSITVLPSPTSTFTTTLTGTIYLYPIESTQYGGDYSLTLPPASSTTISRTTTIYADTVTASTTVPTLITVTASTTTVYAACATDNFANYAEASGETLVFEATSLSGGLKSGFPATSYDCCAQAFQANATRFAVQDVPGLGLQCYIFANFSQTTCPVDQGFAVLAYEDSTRAITIGNGPCGRWDELLD